jgi:hypothetical protein
VGQHYDHKLSDVLLVQDDISRDIFENLRLKLNVEEKKQLEAYGLYLKGRNAWNKRTGDALLQAIDFFNQASRSIRTTAPLRRSRRLLQHARRYGRLEPKEGFPKRKKRRRRRSRSTRGSPKRTTSLAFIKFRWDWDRAATEREFQTAIKLKPATHRAPVVQLVLVAVERLTKRSRRRSERKSSSRFRSWRVRTSGGSTISSGSNDEAIEQCKKILELDPSSFPARRYLGSGVRSEGNVRGSDRGVSNRREAFGQPVDAGAAGSCVCASGKTLKRSRCSPICNSCKTSDTSHLTQSPRFTRDWRQGTGVQVAGHGR